MAEKRKTSDALEILDDIFRADDPSFKEELESELENCRIARQIYDLRQQAGLTQKQLAQKAETTQSVISRLESADYDGHSMAMLRRIAKALNQRVEIVFIPLDRAGDEASDVA
jgi:DNA-binding XRE family transcriptional regulator